MGSIGEGSNVTSKYFVTSEHSKVTIQSFEVTGGYFKVTIECCSQYSKLESLPLFTHTQIGQKR